MAVLPANLKAPQGKIDSAFFPEDSASALDERLQTYITDGVARVGTVLTGTDADDAVKLWSYYRAFEAVYLRLSATPASVDIAGEGSVAFTGAQIASFGTKAQEYKLSFDAALALDAGIEPMIPSGGVPTSVSW